MLAQVFRRSRRMAWLILSGPSPSIDERGLERLLEIIHLSPGVLVLRPEASIPPDVDGWLEDLEALLDQRFNRQDPERLEEPQLADLMRASGLVIAAGGDEQYWLQVFHGTLACGGEPQEEPRVCSYYLVGPAGRVVGQWAYGPGHGPLPGAGWLPGGMIFPEIEDEEGAVSMRGLLRAEPHSYALELPGSATLALGPAGEVDLWGSPKPAIILGQGWINQ